jgi:hypothetical protein
MDAVRRGAGVFLRFFVPLLLLLVLVQVFLAGWGVFGIEEGQGLEETTALDPHRAVGIFLGHLGGLILFLATLAWWPANKRWLGIGLLAGVLLFVQPIFAFIGGVFVGGIHALNAVILLGLLGSLAGFLWRSRRVSVPPT